MIAAANAELLGSWLQLFATGMSSISRVVEVIAQHLERLNVQGAYLVYLPECMTILRTRSRQGASLWLPMTCSLMFGIALAVSARIEWFR